MPEPVCINVAWIKTETLRLKPYIGTRVGIRRTLELRFHEGHAHAPEAAECRSDPPRLARARLSAWLLLRRGLGGVRASQILIKAANPSLATGIARIAMSAETEPDPGAASAYGVHDPPVRILGALRGTAGQPQVQRAGPVRHFASDWLIGGSAEASAFFNRLHVRSYHRDKELKSCQIPPVSSLCLPPVIHLANIP